MPVELSDLLVNKRWVAVEIGEHTLQVAYRPGATSFRRQAELQRQMRQLQKATETDEVDVVVSAGQVFCEIVCDWDLTQNGQPLPITVDTATSLPGLIFNAIMTAIGADGQANASEKKALNAISGATSTQEDRLAIAQNGIQSSAPRGTWASHPGT